MHCRHFIINVREVYRLSWKCKMYYNTSRLGEPIHRQTGYFGTNHISLVVVFIVVGLFILKLEHLLYQAYHIAAIGEEHCLLPS